MSNKTAIVTGVSSCVGCHLARVFADEGWNVVAVTSRPIDAYEGIRAARLAYVGDCSTNAVCELTDARSVERLVLEHKPRLWLQHAGYADAYGSLDYNLAKSLTLNVAALEPIYKALREHGDDTGVILTGTSMEYAASDTANREDEACWPDFPYGVSKLAGTIEAARLARLYNVPTRVARLYIPVAPFDAPGKLIDSVIRSLAENKSIDLSPCDQTRDFLGVADITRAYLALTDDLARTPFDIFNVCSGEATELRELLLRIADLMEADAALLRFGARAMRPGETMVSYGDNAKAHDLLGWSPSPIDVGLRAVIEHVE